MKEGVTVGYQPTRRGPGTGSGFQLLHRDTPADPTGRDGQAFPGG